jgi:hypothetical protein
MRLTELDCAINHPIAGSDWFNAIRQAFQSQVGSDRAIVRFAVTSSEHAKSTVEALVATCDDQVEQRRFPDVFACTPRAYENTTSFNTALVIPTGIGAEIGGHAGDGGPVVRLIAAVSDTVVTHPNVVNASDINELPENALYVEGSALSRMLLGQIGLQPVRSNRILVVSEEHKDKYVRHSVINAVNAARATYGIDCNRIVQAKRPFAMTARYSSSGRAVGEVTDIGGLLETLRECRSEYDAIAISSSIEVPQKYHQEYFNAGGGLVNPWGGVEAMLTHTVTSLLSVPSAHAPISDSLRISKSDPGVVDPRMAAEAVSLTYLQCVLKGLQRSPRIVENVQLGQLGLFDVTNVSCLVIPDGCIGIPTLAALVHGIPVISVRENRNLMKNNLSALPWKEGQLLVAQNYWEAAGIIAALKAGIQVRSVRRPIRSAESSIG